MVKPWVFPAAAATPRAPGTTPVTASATAAPTAASRNLVTPCHATNRPTAPLRSRGKTLHFSASTDRNVVRAAGQCQQPVGGRLPTRRIGPHRAPTWDIMDF